MSVLEAGAPFGLYLDLEDGKLADLETVSRAALEMISAIKDLAALADPSIHIKVAVKSGDEGSLWLKTYIKITLGVDVESNEDRKEAKLTVLQALLFASAVFFGGAVLHHYAEMGLQTFDRKVLGISPDGQPIEEDTDASAEHAARQRQAAEMANELVEGAKRNGTVETHVRNFYGTLGKDLSIRAVGISLDHDAPPLSLVGKDQFADRSRQLRNDVQEGRRKRISREQLLLVQARLTGDGKPWRFKDKGVEFAATITDDQFLKDMLSGKVKVRMIEGVYFDADLAYDEEMIEGVWFVKSRALVKVHGTTEAPHQASLL